MKKSIILEPDEMAAILRYARECSHEGINEPLLDCIESLITKAFERGTEDGKKTKAKPMNIEPAFPGPDPKMIELTETILNQNGEIIKMNSHLLKIITTYTMMVRHVDIGEVDK